MYLALVSIGTYLRRCILEKFESSCREKWWRYIVVVVVNIAKALDQDLENLNEYVTSWMLLANRIMTLLAMFHLFF